jgi:hypothetical protein
LTTWLAEICAADPRVILRTFLLREKDPDCWASIWKLTSHLSELQKEKDYLSKLASVVSFLKVTIGLKEEDIPTIAKIMGIHDIWICNNMQMHLMTRQMFSVLLDWFQC